MPNFLEQECPVCHCLFKQEDDVVVCPDCGAPYHRKCWSSIGQCIYFDKHGTSEQWQPKPSRNDDNIIICENCGTANGENSKFCQKCGHSFDTASTLSFRNKNNYSFFDTTPNTADDDRAAFIGTHVEYYLKRFSQIDKQHNSLSWNWCAAIFPAEWFLYRKMYKSFFIALFLILLLLSPSILIVINNYTAMAGDAEAYRQFLTSGQLPSVQTPMAFALLANAGSTLLFFFRIVFALKSNSLYYSFVQKNIVKIRQECSDPLYCRYLLSKKGGTNLPGVILYIVLLVLLFFIGSFLLILYIQ